MDISCEKIMQYVRDFQPKFFCEGNKRFFQDINYWVMIGKKTGNAFMIRSTYGWSDMFDGIKKKHYRINPIEKNYKLGKLEERVFDSLQDINEWIEEN